MRAKLATLRDHRLLALPARSTLKYAYHQPTYLNSRSRPNARRNAHVARLLAALLLTLPQGVSASCDKFTIGMNKFDLAAQYTGRASGGDGSTEYTAVTRAMARKAIDDALGRGVAYFRIAASGFAPSRIGQASDLATWLNDPSQYWASMDLMMADLRAANICVIPVLVWNKYQFPAMASEPLGALIHNPISASWRLLERFIREFVTRYRNSTNLLFYELTNELNLDADIDIEGSCKKQKHADQCSLATNFTTGDMNKFSARLASLVRSLDQVHKISSGYALPRPAAQHLRQRPQWSSGGADWTPDSTDELTTNLLDTHSSLDIISVHLYPPTSLRLGINLGEEFKIVDVVQSAALKIGKPLFIGEYGQRNIRSAPENSFFSNMTIEIERLKVPYSAAWVWEFYQFATDAPYGSEASSFSLEPGYTDKQIDEITQVNVKHGQLVSSPGSQLTVPGPPIVILTKPLECAAVARGSELFAVASHEGHAVPSVAFFMDGKEIGRVTQPPYRLSLPLSQHTDGVVEIDARACTIINKCSSYKTRVVLGDNNQEAAKKCLLGNPAPLAAE